MVWLTELYYVTDNCLLFTLCPVVMAAVCEMSPDEELRLPERIKENLSNVSD